MNFLGLKEFDIIRSESNDNGDVVYYLTSTYKPNCPACHSILSIQSKYCLTANLLKQVKEFQSHNYKRFYKVGYFKISHSKIRIAKKDPVFSRVFFKVQKQYRRHNIQRHHQNN